MKRSTTKPARNRTASKVRRPSPKRPRSQRAEEPEQRTEKEPPASPLTP